MKTPVPPARLRGAVALLLAATALSACVNVRYDDEHASRSARNYIIAVRMNDTFKNRGMAGVVADIQDCYRQTTVPLIKRFALQDCLSYVCCLSVG